jgi:hypothetical protein
VDANTDWDRGRRGGAAGMLPAGDGGSPPVGPPDRKDIPLVKSGDGVAVIASDADRIVNGSVGTLGGGYLDCEPSRRAWAQQVYQQQQQGPPPEATWAAAAGVIRPLLRRVLGRVARFHILKLASTGALRHGVLCA